MTQSPPGSPPTARSVASSGVAAQIWVRLYLPGPPLLNPLTGAPLPRRAPASLLDGEACGLEALTIKPASPLYPVGTIQDDEMHALDGEPASYVFQCAPYSCYSKYSRGYDYSVDPLSPRHPTRWAAYRPLRWKPFFSDQASRHLHQLMIQPRHLANPDHYLPLHLPAPLL